MELYNFFTELIPETDTDRIEELKLAKKEIEEIFKNEYCELIKRIRRDGSVEWSLIGQVYGDDTNIGDLDLCSIFRYIKYTWFNAYEPTINNLNKPD